MSHEYMPFSSHICWVTGKRFNNILKFIGNEETLQTPGKRHLQSTGCTPEMEICSRTLLWVSVCMRWQALKWLAWEHFCKSKINTQSRLAAHRKAQRVYPNTSSTWSLWPENLSGTLRAAKFQRWEQTRQQGFASLPSNTWIIISCRQRLKIDSFIFAIWSEFVRLWRLRM